ncbi:MAG: hypothetical protein WCQ90_09785 [Deltaproteobacteria bacterium]
MKNLNDISQQEISIGQLASEIIDQINPTATIVSEIYACGTKRVKWSDCWEVTKRFAD